MSKILTYCVKYVDYDNSYKNVPIFRSIHDRNAALVGDSDFSPIFNFDFGNGLYTKAVVNNYDDNANYFILKIDDDGDIEYRFYFITNYSYNAGNQYTLSIECDVISTYFVAPSRSEFTEDLINRAHCNRFDDTPVGGKYHFDVTESSEIIRRETEIDKPVIDRHTALINYHTNTVVNNWLNANIKCWMYIYCDTHHTYRFQKQYVYGKVFAQEEYYDHIIDNNRFIVDGAEITNDYAVCCVPIMREYANIELYDDVIEYRVTLDNRSSEKFLQDFSPYIYNIKFSKIPPVYFGNIDFSFNLSRIVFRKSCNCEQRDGGHICSGFSIDGQVIRSTGRHMQSGVGMDYCYGMLTGVQDHSDIQYFSNFNANFNFSFHPDDIKGSRMMIYEPKLLSHCYSVVIRDSNGGEYKYNPLLYNDNNYEIVYDEPNSITNSNYYIRCKPKGLYSECEDTNWAGISNTVDNSLPIANDNMANFIANNKNFLLTQGIASATNLVSNLISGNVVGAVGGVAQDIFNNFVSIDNIDNMKRNIMNANNTAALTLIVNKGINFYIDIEKAYAIDVVRFYNYIYKFGYKIDKIGNVYDYMFNRHYFNYIQADVEEINRLIPQYAKNKIIDILRNGVRFWHSYADMYNYERENYESFLDY